LERPGLERRYLALFIWWSMIFFENPVPTMGASPMAGFFGIMLYGQTASGRPRHPITLSAKSRTGMRVQ